MTQRGEPLLLDLLKAANTRETGPNQAVMSLQNGLTVSLGERNKKKQKNLTHSHLANVLAEGCEPWLVA